MVKASESGSRGRGSSPTLLICASVFGYVMGRFYNDATPRKLTINQIICNSLILSVD